MEEQVNADLIKQAQEADLIEGGKYRFQVESAEPVENMKEFFDEEGKEKNPFYGKPVFNLRMRLTAKRDGQSKDAPFVTLERPRTYFQKVCSASVLNRKSELSTESKLFGQMASIVVAVVGGNVTNKQVLEWFKDNAAEVTITKTEETEKDGKHYDAKNWTRAIKAIKEQA